jgi:hypothetical protein
MTHMEQAGGFLVNSPVLQAMRPATTYRIGTVASNLLLGNGA